MTDLPDRMRLDELVARSAPRNPKQHDLVYLAGLFQTFGFNDGVILDERTGLIHGGHGRCDALVLTKQRIAQGADLHVPVGITLDEDGEWLVPVQRGWASKDEQHREAALISHNEATLRGGQHAPTLVAMYDDLHSQAPELWRVLDVSQETMDDLLSQVDMDLPDITGDPDYEQPDRAGAPPRAGQEEDTPLDDLEPHPAPSTVGDDPVSAQCPSCGHVFPRSV